MLQRFLFLCTSPPILAPIPRKICSIPCQADPLLSATPVWGYAVWIACTLISSGLLWWHHQYPVAVFTAVFVLHLTGAVCIGNGGLGGVALPLWFSLYALAAFARPIIAAGMATAAWVIAATVQLVLAAAAGIGLAKATN